MTASNRLLVSLVVVAGCLAAVMAVQPGWLADLGLTWQPAQEGERPLLETQRVVCVQRIKAKERLTRQVVNGERSLFEAAAWFGYLNRTPASCADIRWRELPGCSDGEKLCRQVIRWVESFLQGTMSNSQADARVRQLQEELDRHIAQHGTVTLPES